jgi:tRNA(fMet)-specific endonuclease VapC
MNGDYLLDSNIVIDIFRGDSTAIARVKKIKTIYVPVIVIGELYSAPINLTKPQNAYWKSSNLKDLLSFWM